MHTAYCIGRIENKFLPDEGNKTHSQNPSDPYRPHVPPTKK